MAAKVVTSAALTLKMAEEMLSRVGAQLVFAPLGTEDDIIKHAVDADAVIVGSTEPYTQRAIQALGKCKIISRMGIGFNNIDVEEATRQGIPVAVVLDASVHEVSDHAMAFLLAFSRKIFPLTKAVREGVWKAGSSEILKIRDPMFRLTQQSLGLVGVGRIGSRVAQKARAFGMRVLGYDPYLSSWELQERGAEKVDFDRLLRESDFISLHAPLTSETKGMFGLLEFRRMKPTAIIINTARGGIIDEQALYQALVEGSIAGAGLDVTEPEPPRPDSPLLQLEKVLVTAHSAFFSDSSLQELQQKAAEAVIIALRGDWPPFLINPEVKEQENRRIASGSSR
ncbi:MAG: C-terminal binding protein [Deltaproteobacteria bacterium]|nr:C-terminal binding protein [Deltaproteobacteria bacterium]